MKPIALLAAAALAAGCVSSSPPPPIPGSACSQSGVDYVIVTRGGVVVSSLPTIPCLYNYVQGATLAGVGSGTFVVTGYQSVSGFGEVPVYTGQRYVTASYYGDVILYWDFVRYNSSNAPVVTYDPMPDPCPYANCETVHAAGIPDDLDINANFVTANGGSTIGDYCAAAGVGVDEITFDLVDHAGTSVASGNMNCGSSLVPAGIDFRVASNQGIDRDVYSLRAQGNKFIGVPPVATVFFDTATRNTTAQFPNCAPQTIAHYAPDTGAYVWNALLYDISGNATFCP